MPTAPSSSRWSAPAASKSAPEVSRPASRGIGSGAIMRKATELIHAGERLDIGAATALTTPIYETSTFIFESAADVAAYQAGKIDAYLYSRYENPTVVS